MQKLFASSRKVFGSRHGGYFFSISERTTQNTHGFFFLSPPFLLSTLQEINQRLDNDKIIFKDVSIVLAGDKVKKRNWKRRINFFANKFPDTYTSSALSTFGARFCASQEPRKFREENCCVTGGRKKKSNFKNVHLCRRLVEKTDFLRDSEYVECNYVLADENPSSAFITKVCCCML